MLRFVLTCTLVIAFPFWPSHGFDFFRPKANGMGRTIVMSEISSVNALSLPSLGFKPGQWDIAAGYNRRFELADLDQLFVTGAYRYRFLTFAAGTSQFGKTELYAEQVLKGSIAYNAKFWSAAILLSAMNIEIGNGYGGLRAATIGIGGTYRYSDFIVGVTADDLTSPQLAPASERRRPTYDIYLEMIGKSSYSITARLRMQSEQQPVFGLGQTIKLSGRSAVLWGVSTEPFEFGAGLELSLAAGKFSYATSVHPVLGFTHSVSISYGPSETSATRKGEFD